MRRARKAIPKAVKDEVRAMFDGRCGYCGEDMDSMHIDHIKPIKRGGTDDLENLMPSCSVCNNYKYTGDIEYFRNKIADCIRKSRNSSVSFRMAERYELVIIKSTRPVKFLFERWEE